MEHNLEFVKIGEYDLAPFDSYVEFFNGSLGISSAQVFTRNKEDIKSLPIKNQKALRNFEKAMDKKYGKGRHNYKIGVV